MKIPPARLCGAVFVAALIVLSADTPIEAQTEDLALPSPLRLEHVAQRARERRLEIAAMRARARAAAEQPAIVSGLEDPMVSPAIDHLPFMLHGADVSLNVEQRFPLSGVLSKRKRAAQAEAARLRAETKRVALDVELDAVSAFLMLRERRAMTTVLQSQLSLARQLLGTATARYSSGIGTQPELLRAEIEVSRLEAALASWASESFAAEAMLNTSLARSPDAPVPPLEVAVNTTLPSEWTELRKAALRSRPEISAGRAEVRKADAEVTVMEAMDAPMALVRTGPAYTMTDGFGWMLMVGISIPIWRDRINASVREAQAMASMSRADLGAMRRMIEGEVATARYRVMAARVRYVALRDDVVPQAKRVIDAMMASYAAGTAPLVSVLESVQTLWSVESELVAAELDLGLAWALLDRAVARKEVRP